MEDLIAYLLWGLPNILFFVVGIWIARTSAFDRKDWIRIVPIAVVVLIPLSIADGFFDAMADRLISQ